MKKVILALAVVFSVALVSCGSKEKAAEDSAVLDSPVAEVVDSNATEEVADSTVKADEAPATDSAAATEEAAK